jgi:hypothetical protein
LTQINIIGRFGHLPPHLTRSTASRKCNYFLIFTSDLATLLSIEFIMPKELSRRSLRVESATQAGELAAEWHLKIHKKTSRCCIREGISHYSNKFSISQALVTLRDPYYI